MASQRVLIAGGSGFVGKNLSQLLQNKGYSVTLISRSAGPNRIVWADVERNGIPDVDAVVQLSGANVLSRPWTESRKKEIIDSRVHTTQTLVDAIQKSTSPPKVFISGSAIGIYPVSRPEVYDENTTQFANDFAGQMVKEWEDSSLPLETNNKTRRVIARIGVTIGAEGGVMADMLLPFSLGLGAKLGSGKQLMPWIHVEDVSRMVEYAIENKEVKGVLNAVAPEVVTNEQFTKAVGKALNRPAILTLPSFLLKAVFGQRAFLILEGQQVAPKRTLESGFKFKYPDLASALQQIVQEYKQYPNLIFI